MIEVFSKITKTIKWEQKDFIRRIAIKNNPIIKVYISITRKKSLGELEWLYRVIINIK